MLSKPNSNDLNLDARFEVLMVSDMWVDPEDGGRKVLRNVGVPPHYYTLSKSRRQRLGS
jgi:hypothetical protein